MVRMARSSPSWRLVVGVAALALATVFRTSVASSEVAQLRNVDGGQNYCPILEFATDRPELFPDWHLV